MSELAFDTDRDGSDKPAINAALIQMMLESAQRSVEESDYETALEYAIAVLSVEESKPAAIALISVSLSLIRRAQPSTSTFELSKAFAAKARRLNELSFESLANVVSQDQRRTLMQLASSMERHSGPAITPVVRECMAEVIGSVGLLLDSIPGRDLIPSGSRSPMREAVWDAFQMQLEWLPSSDVAAASRSSERSELGFSALYLISTETERTTYRRPGFSLATSLTMPPDGAEWIEVSGNSSLRSVLAQYGDSLLAYESVRSKVRRHILTFRIRSKDEVTIRILVARRRENDR